MRILYKGINNKYYLDINTMSEILNINKSSLYRSLYKLNDIDKIHFKNQILYNENILYNYMKDCLFKKLQIDNGHQNDK